MSPAEDPAATDPVLARLAPRWSATRTEDNLAVAFRRLERAARVRRAAAAGALGLGALALVVGGWVARRSAPAHIAATEDARHVALPDGSTVALGDARARIAVTGASPSRLEVALAGGRAAFEIPRRAGQQVVVTMERFEVAILGAKFELSPEGERARVTVTDGEVGVSWPGGGHARVGAGETALLPPVAAAVESPPDEASDEAPDEAPDEASDEASDEAPPARGGAAERRARFHALVAHRDYAGAYRALVASPDVTERSAEDLMLAADAARLSGHPAAAVPYLRRVLGEHARDARAPVAAFTLGRVLLSELTRPREAADAFAAAYRLAPSGPLAADACAREVEAAARAGDAARARRLAEAFVARYPNEPRAAAVRRAGGLE